MVNSAKSLFTSNRERRLWLLTIAVVVTIYSTLDLAQRLVGELSGRGLSDNAFIFGFLLIGLAVLMLGLNAKPRGIELGVIIGFIAVYIMLFARLGIPERTHLFEYSVVAIFVYQALVERQTNGRIVPSLPLLAIAISSFFGIVDEGIQAILPNRYFDLRDVGFNLLAALMAIVASLVLARVQAWRQHK